jgi:hypothetical protein
LRNINKNEKIILERLRNEQEQGREQSGRINAITTIVACKDYRDVQQKHGIGHPNAYGKIKKI